MSCKTFHPITQQFIIILCSLISTLEMSCSQTSICSFFDVVFHENDSIHTVYCIGGKTIQKLSTFTAYTLLHKESQGCTVKKTKDDIDNDDIDDRDHISIEHGDKYVYCVRVFYCLFISIICSNISIPNK